MGLKGFGIVLVALALIGLSACNSALEENKQDVLSSKSLNQKVRDPASVPRQPAPELGETWTSDDETNAFEASNTIQQMLIKRTADNPLMKRDAHPKHHGCVKAFFKVESKDLPAADRVGIFAHDTEEFPAWVRFSNGDPDSTKPDTDGDVRGMAVKVMGLPESNFLAQAGVEPETGIHDFVMMNSPVFFIKNTKDYAGLMNAVSGNTWLGSPLGLITFMATHPRTAIILQKARGMNVGSPLSIDYFSATPYRLGAGTMKFQARSCVAEKDREPRPRDAAPDYLKDQLVKSLKAKGACFEFFVQKGSGKSDMPVENPMKAWSSPYIKVATLRIPRQTGVDTESRMNFCENVSFNPWRAPAENRPLGAINRVRLQAYGQISELRHDHNRIAAIQPKSHVICTGDTAELCTKPR